MNTKLITLLTAVASAWGCAVGADAEESPEGREWSVSRIGGEIAGEATRVQAMKDDALKMAGDNSYQIDIGV